MPSQLLPRKFLLPALLVLLASPAYSSPGFVHPGLLQSGEDLARMKMAVAAKEEPIISAYEVFRTQPQSRIDYKPRGPLATVGRNPTLGQGDYDSDANAAYQCAIMWCITGEGAYANKSREIINAWSVTLKSITGRDAVLMAGLGPFKMVNAAEILRHTAAEWAPAEIQQAEANFRNVIYPVIRDFAPFANGNWDTAAIKTTMAIAVFCDDRAMFERALHYYLDGAGDGRLTHYIINEAGQCQESGRDQQHTQLGLAHLGDCCEIAWHQGLDLYGYDDRHLLKGFEYTARYNLGEDVPFAESTDRTGKYHHTSISGEGRGRLRAVFEEIYNHYVNRAGIPAPYTQRAAEKIRPEGSGGSGADHVGFGTLLFTRSPSNLAVPEARSAPAAPVTIAQGSAAGTRLIWVASVGADGYLIKRAAGVGDFAVVARGIHSTTYTDRAVEPGEMYRYVVSAANSVGESPDSLPVFICAGVPRPWISRSIGEALVPGGVGFDGSVFTLSGAGAGLAGAADQIESVSKPFTGDGAIVAHFVPQTNSQAAEFGLMMRESPAADSAHVSLLISADAHGQPEAPDWTASQASRAATGANTDFHHGGKELTEPTLTYGRLTGSCWLKLERSGQMFTGSSSDDGETWTQIGAATVALKKDLLVGLCACSRLAGVPTDVRFDNVAVTVGIAPVQQKASGE